MRVRLVLFVACLIIFGSCVTPALGGADLGRRPAPDFTLVDGPTGETVSLSALRGNVVVLAFLYMACPDVCPRTAEKLLAARDGVGSAGSILALVAVSVAPDRDTPEATRRFLSNHRLEGTMRFLIGDRGALAAVWARYGVYAAAESGGTVGHNDVAIDAGGNRYACDVLNYRIQKFATGH